MADSGALITTDRATVTCAGSPTATAAKIPMRTTIPRTNRIIGRITPPPSRRAFDGRSLEVGPKRGQSKPLAFSAKAITVRPSTRGRAGDESFATNHRGIHHLGDLGRLGHHRNV